jgi:hypothetical protein
MTELLEPTVVAEGADYVLISCGQGSSYRLSFKEEKMSALVEGDDVPGFIAEYESIKSQYPSYSVDQVLAQLWDQGGYSWMAVPDEE